MDVTTQILKALIEGPPMFRRPVSRWTYDLISTGFSHQVPDEAIHSTDPARIAEISFMNYGYVDDRFEEQPLELLPEHECVRYSIQLYHQLIRDVDLRSKKVLEVGSGRGGGSSYLARYREPDSVTGLELSGKAVAFCRQAHVSDRLRFIEGDAQDLPFEDESFDVLVNVESSGCYPSFDTFLSEVARVLRPGGWFCWADARFADSLPAIERSFAHAGLEVVEHADISAEVVRGLTEAAQGKMNTINELPRLVRPIAASALAMPGTLVFNAIAGGHLRYLKKVLRKVI